MTVTPALVNFSNIPVSLPGGLAAIAPHLVPIASTEDAATTKEDCAQLCLRDHNMTIDKGNTMWVSSNNQYYPSDPQLPTTPLTPSLPIPTYRCAGFAMDGTTCTLYNGDALVSVVEADSSTVETETTPTAIDYWDMNCFHSGTRGNISSETTESLYCHCNQNHAIVNDNFEHAMFEGDRCTVPATWQHSMNLHGSFNRYDDDFQHSAKSPAHHRWANSFPTDHPSSGYNVDHQTGVPFPIIAMDQAGPPGTTSLVTGAMTPVSKPHDSSNTPPTGISFGASMSGQCAIPTSGDSGACGLRKTMNCPKKNGDTDNADDTDACCATECPPAAPQGTHGGVSNVNTSDEFSVGASTATTGGISIPSSANLGTQGGPQGWCSTGTNSDGTSIGCQACVGGSSPSGKGACTNEPESFKIAAETFAKCIANARAMVHAGEASADDVTTWSALQQKGLSQILGSVGKCSTHYKEDDKTSAGVGLRLFPPDFNAGASTSHSVDAGATDCESLFAATNALSEFTANNNCVMNSSQSCQSTFTCNAQNMNAKITSTGKDATITIDQEGSSNVSASANYTTEFTNKVTNATQQSMSAIVKQINKQLQANEASAGAGGIVHADAGVPPPQGPRNFSNLAASMQSLTNNSVSNSIKNSQVTDVTQVEDLDINIVSTGDDADISIKQKGILDAQVSEITKNAVDNQLSNSTIQNLISNTNQDNEDKNQMRIIFIAIVLVLVIGGGIVAAIFIGKFAAKEGKKLLEHHKSMDTSAVATPS
jgi:hypothetical protein